MADLRLLEVHTVPVWEEPSGERRPGIDAERDPPPVVGWCNVAVLDVVGERHRLVLTLDA